MFIIMRVNLLNHLLEAVDWQLFFYNYQEICEYIKYISCVIKTTAETFDTLVGLVELYLT